METGYYFQSVGRLNNLRKHDRGGRIIKCLPREKLYKGREWVDRKIVVLGAGGHSRSVCDILLQDARNHVVGLVDAQAVKGFWGIPVLGGDEVLPGLRETGEAEYTFVAIGDNLLRRKLIEQVVCLGYKMVNAISSHAILSPHADLGQGVAVMPGAIVGANAVIDTGAIINTNASVDHDVQVGAHCHVAPGAVICGSVSLGDGVFIGAGARVIDGLNIGSHTTVGAGAAVIHDLPSNCVAVGVPARIIKRKGE